MAFAASALTLSLAQYFEGVKRANSKVSFTVTGTAVTLSALLVFVIIQLMAVSNAVPPVKEYLTNVRNANFAPICAEDVYIETRTPFIGAQGQAEGLNDMLMKVENICISMIAFTGLGIIMAIVRQLMICKRNNELINIDITIHGHRNTLINEESYL